MTQSGASEPTVIGAARSGELAVGDVSGDSLSDRVIGASNGTVYIRPSAGAPSSFTPFAAYAGPLFVAVGNLDADAPAEIVAAMGGGGSAAYRVFNADGSAVADAVVPYAASFTGGVRVAVGNVSGDVTKEVVTGAGPGGAAHVKVFNAAGTPLAQFIAYEPEFAGGVFVAAGNLDDDSAEEILVGPGASPNWRNPRGFNGDGSEVSLGLTPGPLFKQSDTRVAVGLVNGSQSFVTAARQVDTAAIGVHSIPPGTFRSVAPPDADGSLSPAVADGKVWTLDTGPRLIRLSSPTLKEHTRNAVTLYGASLDLLANQTITLGEGQDAFEVPAEETGTDELTFRLDVPAFVAPGTLPITLSNYEDPRQISSDTLLSITAHDPPLDEFVTTGVGIGGGPHVRTFGSEGPVGGGFFAGAAGEHSGVRVARGDLDGDGVDEIITAPGPGAPPFVRVFTPSGGLVRQFLAYDQGFLGGLYVAVGNVGSEPGNRIITAPDAGGGPHVKVFNGQGVVMNQFMAYDPTFTGGVRLATGDVDNDSVDEVITAPGAGGGPHVKVQSADGALLQGFMAYDPGFTGGVFVAAVDLAAPGFDQVITAPGAGGGPHVKVFVDGKSTLGFMAYDPGFTGGVTVGAIGDEIFGSQAIITAPGAGGGPHVRIVDAYGESYDEFMAYDPGFTGGVFVAGGIA